MSRLKVNHYWLLVLLFVSLLSCQKEVKEQLIGQWDFKNATDPELQESFGALSESLGTDIDLVSASSITNPYFQNNFLQFEEGNCSVLLGVAGHTLAGSWTYNTADSVITINDTKQNEELKVKVIELTNEELKVHLVTNDTTFNAGKIEITFAKGNK